MYTIVFEIPANCIIGQITSTSNTNRSSPKLYLSITSSKIHRILQNSEIYLDEVSLNRFSKNDLYKYIYLQKLQMLLTT